MLLPWSLIFSLNSDGSTETDLFCEGVENVVNDFILVPCQTDPLNMLEPWKLLVSIDNGELVSIVVTFIFPFVHWHPA